MTENTLRGVIAAIPTPFDVHLEPDTARFVKFGRHLLDNGCDGLNICGTTGEATSMSVRQRKSLMSAAASALPRDRLMVGTGAASIADAIELTHYAGELGFAGALVLPPFYYKNVPDDGVFSYFETLASMTVAHSIPLYLYHFPQLSGVPFHPALLSALREQLGSRLRGLKDSSGEMEYARQVASQEPSLDVFPSNEAALLDARAGIFAGCISATANLSSQLCADAYRQGDLRSLQTAVEIRKCLSSGPLIPRVKGGVASMTDDAEFAMVLPPLTTLSANEIRQLASDLAQISHDEPNLRTKAPTRLML